MNELTALTTELFEELDAFDPRWQSGYRTIGHAAQAADVLDLYKKWLETPEGVKYLAIVRDVPDHVGRSRALAEIERAQPRSLPFGYDNLGWLPNSAWDPS